MDKFNLCYEILLWSMDAAVCIDFESDSIEDFLLLQTRRYIWVGLTSNFKK